MMPQTRETVKTYSTLSTTAPRLGRLVATTPGPGHLYRLLTQFVHSVRPSRRSHLTRLRRLRYQLGPPQRSVSCFKGRTTARRSPLVLAWASDCLIPATLLQIGLMYELPISHLDERS